MKISKLLSLYNLAKSSDSEESKNAMVLLKKLLQCSGMTLEELLETQNDEKLQFFEIKYNDKNEQTIIHHIASKHKVVLKRYKDKRKGKILLVESTKAFFTSFKQEIDFYIELFKKDLHILLTAFVNKHNLFPPEKEVVVYRRAEYEKYFQMTELLSEETFLKSIK